MEIRGFSTDISHKIDLYLQTWDEDDIKSTPFISFDPYFLLFRSVY